MTDGEFVDIELGEPTLINEEDKIKSNCTSIVYLFIFIFACISLFCVIYNIKLFTLFLVKLYKINYLSYIT